MSTGFSTTLLLIGMLFMGCGRSESKLAFAAHSTVTIPASAKLMHSGVQYAGFDASYGFVIDVSDNELQKLLIDEWQLQAGEPTALAAVDRRSNRSSSINLPMQPNFQFNLHWNEPNPCTLQTSKQAASADGSLARQGFWGTRQYSRNA